MDGWTDEGLSFDADSQACALIVKKHITMYGSKNRAPSRSIERAKSPISPGH